MSIFMEAAMLPSPEEGRVRKGRPQKPHTPIAQRLTVTASALSDTVEILLKPKSPVLLKRHLLCAAASGMRQQLNVLRLPDEPQEKRNRSWAVDGFSRLKHEVAWYSTFSCLRTSQTRDSAGFQNIRLTETRELRLPDDPQEGRNRSWIFSNLMSSTLQRR
ncbi:hypothetical protein T265_04325 [Opisthorchis viverrini]|uniref:Uncharacterized protein n=1 Tax=Opisthorchis viverrini TaxID=6198 RepID=A0A075AGQ0_OPIVI|nr:hypothetical protein T265_04325 [Opisthorchis viverrini]KER28944.1 hypothetical protein T265_04325 [Opisthorchis viverrini]